MTDRPILFSGPMVRALIAGRKTQTRRLLKPQPTLNSAGLLIWEARGDFVQGKPEDIAFAQRIHVGDRLWVKETWAPLTYLTHNDPGPQAIIDGGFYRADEGTVDGEVSKWKPSIFMPRHASRLTLTVTDVRVERLQDISESDAVAEGIERHKAGWMPYNTAFFEADGTTPAGYHPAPRDSYRSLWNVINGFEGPKSWDANPWIVAYSFSVHHGNIDEAQP